MQMKNRTRPNVSNPVPEDNELYSMQIRTARPQGHAKRTLVAAGLVARLWIWISAVVWPSDEQEQGMVVEEAETVVEAESCEPSTRWPHCQLVPPLMTAAAL
jgi:hypothetical protein